MKNIAYLISSTVILTLILANQKSENRTINFLVPLIYAVLEEAEHINDTNENKHVAKEFSDIKNQLNYKTKHLTNKPQNSHQTPLPPSWQYLLDVVEQWTFDNTLLVDPLIQKIDEQLKIDNSNLTKEEIDTYYLQLTKFPANVSDKLLPAIAYFYFKKQNYADSLKVIYEIYKIHPQLAILYSSIQSIYSHKHKGGGSVALQAL